MIKATNKITGKLNSSIIKVYPELEDIEITPKVENQEFQSEMYGYNKVKVKGVQAYIDEDIKPEYIKSVQLFWRIDRKNYAERIIGYGLC